MANYVGALSDLGDTGAKIDASGLGFALRGWFKFPGIDKFLYWTWTPGDFSTPERHYVYLLDATDPEHLVISPSTRIWNAPEFDVMFGLCPDPVDGHTWLFAGRGDSNDTTAGNGRMGTFVTPGASSVATGTFQFLPKGGFTPNPVTTGPTSEGIHIHNPAFSRELAMPLGPLAGVLIPNGQVQPSDPSEEFGDFSTVGAAGTWAYPFSFTQAAFTFLPAVEWTPGRPMRVDWAYPLNDSQILLSMREFGYTSNGSIDNVNVGNWLQVMDGGCGVGIRVDVATTGMTAPAARVLPDGRVLLWEIDWTFAALPGGGTQSTSSVKWAYLTIGEDLSISVGPLGVAPTDIAVFDFHSSPSPAPLPGWAFPVFEDEVWIPIGPAIRFARNPDGSLKDEGDLYSAFSSPVYGEPVFRPSGGGSEFDLASEASEKRLLAAVSNPSFGGSSGFDDYFFHDPSDFHRLEVVVGTRRALDASIETLAPFKDIAPPGAWLTVDPP